MNKLYKITWLVTVCFLCLACNKKEIEVNEISSCNLATDYSTHPKNEKLQAILDKYAGKGLVGISVSINQDGERWEGTSGFASIEKGVKLQPCHLMYSASIGKLYCAVATMLLVEQGKIELDAKINNYLPSEITDRIANGNTATVRQLLNHTAGLPNVDNNLNFGTTLFNDPYSLNTENILEFIYDEKAIYEPGEKHHYSSTGYELLTRIIDQVAGEDHAVFYRKNLFQAYGFNDTYYEEPLENLASRLPNNYFERYGNGKIENISQVNFHLQNALTGSDGIIALPSDYVAFLTRLMNEEILSVESLEQMKQFVFTNEEETVAYGLGLRARQSPYGIYVGHGGRSLGAGMDLYHFPSKKTTICLSTNLGTYLESDLVNIYQGPLWVELVDAVFE